MSCPPAIGMTNKRWAPVVLAGEECQDWLLIRCHRALTSFLDK